MQHEIANMELFHVTVNFTEYTTIIENTIPCAKLSIHMWKYGVSYLILVLKKELGLHKYSLFVAE